MRTATRAKSTHKHAHRNGTKQPQLNQQQTTQRTHNQTNTQTNNTKNATAKNHTHEYHTEQCSSCAENSAAQSTNCTQIARAQTHHPKLDPNLHQPSSARTHWMSHTFEPLPPEAAIAPTDLDKLATHWVPPLSSDFVFQQKNATTTSSSNQFSFISEKEAQPGAHLRSSTSPLAVTRAQARLPPRPLPERSSPPACQLGYPTNVQHSFCATLSASINSVAHDEFCGVLQNEARARRTPPRPLKI